MKIIYNNIIPFKGFKVINICGILFARKGACIDERTIRHESIHTKQIIETLVIGFYLIYLVNWIVNLFIYGFNKKAYYNILFEKEAYEYEWYYDYLNTRKHFKWLRL